VLAALRDNEWSWSAGGVVQSGGEWTWNDNEEIGGGGGSGTPQTLAPAHHATDAHGTDAHGALWLPDPVTAQIPSVNAMVLCAGAACTHDTRGYAICAACGVVQPGSWLCGACKMLTNAGYQACMNSFGGGCPGTRATGRAPTPEEGEALASTMVTARAARAHAASIRGSAPSRGGGKGFGKGKGRAASLGKGKGAPRVRYGATDYTPFAPGTDAFFGYPPCSYPFTGSN